MTIEIRDINPNWRQDIGDEEIIFIKPRELNVLLQNGNRRFLIGYRADDEGGWIEFTNEEDRIELPKPWLIDEGRFFRNNRAEAFIHVDLKLGDTADLIAKGERVATVIHT